ncbi:MAG: FHA domain-containing protein [Chitinispirillaceae bacterium]|nr:FHA domain-containing protein [Chitinispirillaceae bacterium]
MAKFVVFYNNELLKTYELDEPVISIGRLPENTISIANMGVSRRHVKIEEDTDRSYLCSDLNSLNGTYVNGKRIKKVTLQSGDRIAIGKYTIIYEEVSGNRNYHPAESEAEPVKPLAREFIGSPDISYVHRTTEPRMRAVYNDRPTVVADSSGNTVSDIPQGADNSAVLIETNKHVVHKLDKKFLTMGNSEEDDIFISGFMVTEHQVSIEVLPDGIHISTNKLMGKIKVNGKPMRHHILQHKDRIEVGSSTFRYMENG